MADLGQALRDVAKGGQLEAVRTLLGQGADVEARDGIYQRTPHYCAAWRGHLEVAELLLDSKALIDAPNSWKFTRWLSRPGKRRAGCGQQVHPSLSPETVADRRDALTAVWRAGPHPSQMQRRRDEAWDRRKSLMQVTAENRYRPLSHVSAMLAAEAVGPAAAIPAIPLDNAGPPGAVQRGHPPPHRELPVSVSVSARLRVGESSNSDKVMIVMIIVLTTVRLRLCEQCDCKCVKERR